MANTVRTDVVVNGRAQGFGAVGAAAQGLSQKSAAAMAKVQKEIDGLDKSFQKLTDTQVKLQTEMAAIDDKASPAFKKLDKQMQGLRKESSHNERILQTLKKAYRDLDIVADQSARKQQQRAREQERTEKKRGAFFQGLGQGLIPEAAYLQRGPGMMRQAAGAYLGGRARGLAGGLASMPFTGAAGLGQALQSIPGGGLLAAPLMQSMGYAQQSLQFQTQQMQMRPFLNLGAKTGGTITEGESAAQQRRRVTTQIDEMLAQQGGKPAGLARAPVTDIFSGPGRTIVGELFKRFRGATGGGRPEWGELERTRAREVEAAGGEEAYAAQERQRMIKRAIAKEGVSSQITRPETLQDLARIQGRKMGFALPEASQLLGGITQAGGGIGRELISQQMGVTGMAAQRRFGIGADVSGAFLQAGRRGGAVGAIGRGGEAMTEAIAGAMRMGLEGSELTQWLQQMAGDIRNWKQTGIPIDPTSVNAMGASLGQVVGGVRGGVMARGVQARAQQLSERGPQTAAEFIMLQEMGGFGGGGLADLEQAQLRLEEGQYVEGGFQRMIQRLSGGKGGGVRGRKRMRGALSRLGVQISGREAISFQAGDISPERIAQMEEVAARAPTSPEEMAKAARGIAPAAVSRQAAQVNTQIAIGKRMVPIMQNLEASTRTIADGFTKLAAADLAKLSGSVVEMSKAIPLVVERLKAYVGGGGNWVEMAQEAATTDGGGS